MASLATLTADCLTKIVSGMDVYKPILQILGSIKIASTEGTDRYRLLVSDGVGLYSSAILGTKLNNLVNEGQLSDNSIVRINRYVTHMSIQSDNVTLKKELIVLDLNVLHPGPEVGKHIGAPVSIDVDKKPQPVATTNNNNNDGRGSMSSNIPNANGMSENQAKETYNNNNMDTSINSSQLLNTSLRHPIASLSPYQKKYAIKVRVIGKSTIRTWNNAKGDGTLFIVFSVDVLDGNEIRCTVFKDGVDRFYDIFKVGKVYFLANAKLRVADNNPFSSRKNYHEIVLTSDAIVQLCEGPVDSIPDLQYNLVPISQIARSNLTRKSKIKKRYI